MLWLVLLLVLLSGHAYRHDSNRNATTKALQQGCRHAIDLSQQSPLTTGCQLQSRIRNLRGKNPRSESVSYATDAAAYSHIPACNIYCRLCVQVRGNYRPSATLLRADHDLAGIK
jgi:hypothetical protein